MLLCKVYIPDHLFFNGFKYTVIYIPWVAFVNEWSQQGEGILPTGLHHLVFKVLVCKTTKRAPESGNKNPNLLNHQFSIDVKTLFDPQQIYPPGIRQTLNVLLNSWGPKEDIWGYASDIIETFILEMFGQGKNQ